MIRDDVKEYMQLARERNARVRHRAILAGVVAVPVVALVLLLVFRVSGPAFWIAIVGIVDGLGFVGRRRDVPLISHATTPLHLAPVLRREAVEIALRAIPNLMKKDAVVEFPDPIIKDGPGYLAQSTSRTGSPRPTSWQTPRPRVQAAPPDRLYVAGGRSAPRRAARLVGR